MDIPKWNYVRSIPKWEAELVALTGIRWNIFVPWLREMDDLWRSNLFAALGAIGA
jgi:hypothetical protein